mmetsp:Transcript_32458/g.40733  ORF Transcript_32458/g.40733 Transcript_32458/m.40733 type:complete len:94 (-) Transcript_32458:301-582(-)
MPSAKNSSPNEVENWNSSKTPRVRLITFQIEFVFPSTKWKANRCRFTSSYSLAVVDFGFIPWCFLFFCFFFLILFLKLSENLCVITTECEYDG